jgi:hypothetical protein
MVDQILAHILAAAAGVNGPVSARLKNTGAMSAARKKFPLAVLLFVLFDAVVMLSALGYFSWAYLGWWPLLTFIAVYFTVGERAARLESEFDSWVVLIASVVIVAIAECLLLFR